MSPAGGSWSGLLGRAEAAALGGPPAAALQPLEVLLDPSLGIPAALRNRAGWLHGVALGALGRYGEALAGLEPLLAGHGSGSSASPAEIVTGALASATAASLLRQIGDHAGAEPIDTAGLALLDRLDGTVAHVDEARLDCYIGLTADAVGVGDLAAAGDRLARARAATAAHSSSSLWRPRVRLCWVAAEVALLAADPDAALDAARAAVTVAEDRGAVRHLAKSLMFLGVAQGGSASGSSAAAHDSLLRAAGLADAHGLLPLVWPIRAVLGTMPGLLGSLDEPAERHLDRSRSAARRIAAGLPSDRVDRWTARDPMAAFLLAGG
jgi:hypothetical protein